MTKDKVFIDSAAYIALFNKREQNHERSVEIFNKILHSSHLYTSDYIFDEVVTFSNVRYGHQKACEVSISILKTSLVQLIIIDRDLLKLSHDRFLKSPKKKISFTDISSTVVMDQYKIDFVFTFDSHFQSMGYQMVS